MTFCILDLFCCRVVADHGGVDGVARWGLEEQKANVLRVSRDRNLETLEGQKTPPAPDFDLNCRHVSLSHAQCDVTHPKLHNNPRPGACGKTSTTRC